MIKKPFKSVHANHPGRSVFDLSYSKLFTCDMGQLIPIMHDEMIPGDKFSVGNEIVVRFNPLVAPVLHQITCYVHYFFVPYRILWPDTENGGGWEKFITGGADGLQTATLPRWNYFGSTYTDVGSLWDYMGYPPNIDPTEADAYPLDFARRAYYMIWNEYYRDEYLNPKLDITSQTDAYNTHILLRNWEKDYFTSALLWQQRGTAPSLPISGNASAVWPDSDFEESMTGYHAGWQDATVDKKLYVQASTGGSAANAKAFFADNSVDLTNVHGFTIADLRLAFQIQRFLERNARGGARYTEFLHSHFGVSPKDARLMRPEYIGGSKSPIIISEVLQTSETSTTPQGTMAGHGISASTQFCGDYFAQEFGIIMGIMSIVPKPMYSQGINRQFLRRTKYDFYFPEFANLSEQAIEEEEIYVRSSGNRDIFGYQGRYDEMRYKPNMVCSLMRPNVAGNLGFWHLSRYFGTKPDLNSTFIGCNPDKRIFAVTNQPGLIVLFGNNIKAIRPIPISSEPGLIDH